MGVAGLGLLLERQPQPTTVIKLRFAHPNTGKPLYELSTSWASTVKEVRAAICKATGLQTSSMLLSRGRAAQSADTLGDGETMWECGFSDGDEVPYMYMGDGTTDLAAFLAAASLVDSKPKVLVLHGRNSNSAVRQRQSTTRRDVAAPYASTDALACISRAASR